MINISECNTREDQSKGHSFAVLLPIFRHSSEPHGRFSEALTGYLCLVWSHPTVDPANHGGRRGSPHILLMTDTGNKLFQFLLHLYAQSNVSL